MRTLPPHFRSFFGSSRFLWMLAAFLFAVLVTNPLSNRIYDWRSVWPLVLALLIIAVPLALWRTWVEERSEERWRTAALRSQFALFTTACALQPASLNFQQQRAAGDRDLHRRPFNPTYIPRRLDSAGISGAPADSSTAIDEGELADMLQRGEDAVIVGPPLEGKTRLAYEVLKGLPSATLILTPQRGDNLLDEEALDLARDQHVILFIDDLNDFAGRSVDLQSLRRSLAQCAASVAVLATAREGPELTAVRTAATSSVLRAFENTHILRLHPLTVQEKRRLIEGEGKVWLAYDELRYPTPGSIVMQESFHAMANRFAVLPLPARDLLRSIKLLDAGAVHPISVERLRAIWERLFKHEASTIAPLVEELQDLAFLQPSSAPDLLQPEYAYIRNDIIVPYTVGRSIDDDLLLARNALVGLHDTEGLQFIAAALELKEDHVAALETMDLAANIDPENRQVIGNRILMHMNHGDVEGALHILENAPGDEDFDFLRAQLLLKLDRPTEALAILDRLIERKYSETPDEESLGAPPDLAHLDEFGHRTRTGYALISERFFVKAHRASALKALGRFEDAIEQYDEILHYHPHWALVWQNKGFALAQLERYDKALACLDKSLLYWPAKPSTLHQKGQVLHRLNRDHEALSVLQESLEVDPQSIDVMRTLMNVLHALGRSEDAIQTGSAILKLNPATPDVHRAIGLAHAALGHTNTALSFLRKAVEVNPTDGEAWHDLARMLDDAEEIDDALKAYDTAVQLEPQEPAFLSNRGVARARIGDLEAAVCDFNAALAQDPRFVPALVSLSAVLLDLDRNIEAFAIAQRAVQTDPNNEDAQVNFRVAYERNRKV